MEIIVKKMFDLVKKDKKNMIFLLCILFLLCSSSLFMLCYDKDTFLQLDIIKLLLINTAIVLPSLLMLSYASYLKFDDDSEIDFYGKIIVCLSTGAILTGCIMYVCLISVNFIGFYWIYIIHIYEVLLCIFYWIKNKLKSKKE